MNREQIRWIMQSDIEIDIRDWAFSVTRLTDQWSYWRAEYNPRVAYICTGIHQHFAVSGSNVRYLVRTSKMHSVRSHLLIASSQHRNSDPLLHTSCSPGRQWTNGPMDPSACYGKHGTQWDFDSSTLPSSSSLQSHHHVDTPRFSMRHK